MAFLRRYLPLICSLLLVAPAALRAQFSPALLQNDSYWGDGRAEFDLYDAQVMREGQPRHCEMTLILTRDTFKPEPTVSSNAPPARNEPVPGIRMLAMYTVPMGLFAEESSLSLFWNVAADFLNGSLVTATRKGHRITRAEGGPKMSARCIELRNEQGELSGMDYFFPHQGTGILYDELPLRVRTIEFTKPAAEIEFQMAAPLASPGEFKAARASYKVTDRAIEVEIREGGALDRFVLDRDFPFLLREWKTRDGSQFKLKNSLKVDLANYAKNGDRERALKDPMLRHPD